jgi:hypothetical protein
MNQFDEKTIRFQIESIDTLKRLIEARSNQKRDIRKFRSEADYAFPISFPMVFQKISVILEVMPGIPSVSIVLIRMS